MISKLQLSTVMKWLCIVSFLWIYHDDGIAQHTVSGTVYDANTAEPLPGVSILVMGTNTGTATNVEGEFQLNVPSEESVLVFTFVGYERLEVPVEGRSQIEIELTQSILLADDIVVVGYGVQRRQDLTGSIGIVDAEQMKRVSRENIGDALQGRVAGLTVQSTGAPGENPSLKIRGTGTFGNNEPLYVIDGVPVTSLQDFNMQDVESIQVLKGPSSAAVYGARAANGVVIITTTQGERGDIMVDYNGKVGIQDFYQRMDMMNAEQFKELNTIARANVGLPPAAAADPNHPDYVGDIDTDWQDETFTTGLQQDHNLTLSGGGEHSTYSLSLGFIEQENTVRGRAPRYERYSGRINSTHNLVDDRFRIGQSAYFSTGERINQTSRHFASLVANTVRMIPIVPVFDESREGGFGVPPSGMETENSLNPIGANTLLENVDDVSRFLGNIWGEYDIRDNLTYKLNFSFDRRDSRNTFFEPHYDLGVFFTNNTARLTETTTQSTSLLIENTLNYLLDLENHSFDILLGYTEQRNDFEFIQGHAEGFTQPYFTVLNAGTDNLEVEGWRSENNLRSMFGRVNYDYDSRYLVSTTVRRDGSSRFGPENRYGVFPSVSAAWHLNNEAFFNVPMISELKFRGEYGVLGNQEIGNYLFQAFVSTSGYGTHYVLNNQLAPGAIQTGLSDPNIKWESNISMSFGVDLGLFEDRLRFSADYYHSETEDLLVGVPISPSVGAFGNPTINAASMRNKGLEFDLQYRDMSGGLYYSIFANLTTLNNEVLSLGGGEPIFGTASKTEVGGEVGQIFGYVTDGLFQNEQEIEDHAFQNPNTAPGDIRFKDLNGDGVINADDRQYLGSAIPTFTYGFGGNLEYRNWDLSLQFMGNYGNKIVNWVREQSENMALFWNYTTRMADHWSPENTNTDIPRPAYQDPNGNGRLNSDRWVEDGSFLRLQTLQLGYSIPVSALERFGMRNLRINGTVQNVFTITNYTGLDPNLGTAGWNNANDGMFNRGVDSGSFPHPRVFLLGIQLGI